MKTKLNILCFLLLIAFAGCMYNAFLGGMEGASDASRGDIGNKLQPLFYVNVVPTEGNELVFFTDRKYQSDETIKSAQGDQTKGYGYYSHN